MKIKYHKKINLSSFGRNADWRVEIANDQKELAYKLKKHTDFVNICPICENLEKKKLVEIYNYTYQECINCNHIYNETPPNYEKIKKLYTNSEDNEDKSVQGKIYISKENFEKRVKIIAEPKAKFIAEAIDKKGKWVDIGAGVGDLVVSAKKIGWDVIGIESDKEEVEFALGMGVNIINDYLDEQNVNGYLKDASVVSLINVLEHIPNVRSFLKLITSNLNKGAYIAFEVPRHPSISSLSNLTFPELAARHIYSPDHVHIFSDKSVELLLNSLGFKITNKWLFGQDAFELIGSAIATSKIKDENYISQLLGVISEIQKVIDKANLSDTFLIVAQKGF